MLQAALKSPVVVVRGPLGSGKSSTVALALADDVRPVAWHQVQPWHAGAFVRPLVETIRELRPDFGRRALAFAESASDAGPLRGQRMGAALSSDLGHVKDSIVIVVDDAQWLLDDPLFGGFLEGVARALPGHARLIVIARALPAFGLAELAAQRRAAVIEAERLRFSSDDVAMLARSLHVEATDANNILAATEGWPLAVRLALDQGVGALPASRNSRSAIDSILVEGVLARLPPVLRAMLESLAILETVDVRVVARDAGWANVREVMRELQQHGALVSTLAEGDVYRIHPLLREAALGDVEAERGFAPIAEAHARAARVYAAAGQVAPALFHVERARNRDLALEFLRLYARDAQRSGELRHLASIASHVRGDGMDEEPAVLYVDGLFAKAQGSPNAASVFAKVAGLADAGGDPALGFAAHAQAIEIAMGRVEPVGAGDVSDLLARARGLGTGAQATAAVLAGWSDALRGDLTGALAHVGAFVDSDDLAIRADAAILRAYAETVLGDSASAERTLSRLLRALEASDRIVAQAQALGWYARLGLLWGEMTAALDAAREATRLSAQLDVLAEEGARAATLAEAAIHKGDAATANAASLDLLARGGSAWYESDARRTAGMAASLQARAAFLSGDLAAACDLARAGAALPNAPSAQRASLLADAAVFASISGSPEASALRADALAMLGGATSVDVADVAQLATSSGMLSWFAPNVRAQPPAFDIVIARRDPVRLEVIGVALRGVVDGKEPVAALAASLDVLTKRGARFEAAVAAVAGARTLAGSPDRLRALRVALAPTLERFDDALVLRDLRNPAAATPEAPGMELTAREAEILALLADGLTNKEMAQRLSLSPRTVETHVERVLGKLEVRSRSQAVAKALRLELV